MNSTEKYYTDRESLDSLQIVGNVLGLFMGNMLRGGTVAKAKEVAKSLTTDMKIIILTEALAHDLKTVYHPILSHFEEASILIAPRIPTCAKKAADQLVLFDGPIMKGLNFALRVSTLNISVVATKDSDDKMSL